MDIEDLSEEQWNNNKRNHACMSHEHITTHS